MPPAMRHGFFHFTHPDARVPGREIPEATSLPLSSRQLSIALLISIVIAWAGFLSEHAAHGVADARVGLPWILPFFILLIGIAMMPFIAGRWWERHYNKVSVGFALLVLIYYCTRVADGPANIGRSIGDYVSFMFLLGSLFIISGGILIRVRARATPLANTMLLLAGAILANALGTTGAAMLLIRPFLRMNDGRLRPFHTVFFIFIVANAGGSLTPIGPPLFLGYLQGIPFFWVFQHCWPASLLANGVLLAIFFVFDTLAARRNPPATYAGKDLGPVISLYGMSNLLFIGIAIFGILMNEQLNDWTQTYLGLQGPWREILLALAACGSLATTPLRIHGENHFNYAPIKEVAYLFVGIFVTMVPTLNYLSYHAASLHLSRPGDYYFSCGILSSVLDNAPTYLTFLKVRLATIDAPMNVRLAMLLNDPSMNRTLVGTSLGAVLFGGMTYIGNGPNFMVKTIADHADAPTPSFFGYIGKFALPILLPVLVLVWLTLLR